MNDYNFWSDLLDTFQSSPDWIKALWLLIPPGFLLGLVRSTCAGAWAKAVPNRPSARRWGHYFVSLASWLLMMAMNNPGSPSARAESMAP